MIPLVLTFVGDDRPGLVKAIAEKVADCGATWLESRSVRLRAYGPPRRSPQAGRQRQRAPLVCPPSRLECITPSHQPSAIAIAVVLSPEPIGYHRSPRPVQRRCRVRARRRREPVRQPIQT